MSIVWWCVRHLTNLGGIHWHKMIHQKLLLFSPIFEDNLIQFTSPIVFDGPATIKIGLHHFELKWATMWLIILSEILNGGKIFQKNFVLDWVTHYWIDAVNLMGDPLFTKVTLNRFKISWSLKIVSPFVWLRIPCFPLTGDLYSLLMTPHIFFSVHIIFWLWVLAFKGGIESFSYCTGSLYNLLGAFL